MYKKKNAFVIKIEKCTVKKKLKRFMQSELNSSNINSHHEGRRLERSKLNIKKKELKLVL